MVADPDIDAEIEAQLREIGILPPLPKHQPVAQPKVSAPLTSKPVAKPGEF